MSALFFACAKRSFYGKFHGWFRVFFHKFPGQHQRPFQRQRPARRHYCTLGKLKVGLSGEYFFTAKAQNNNGVFSLNDSGIIAGTSGSAYVRIPPNAALGASYSFSPEWLAAPMYRGFLEQLHVRRLA